MQPCSTRHERRMHALKAALRACICHTLQLLSAKSIGQCSSGSVTKLQDQVHKLERLAESMKTSKQEADKQLQVGCCFALLVFGPGWPAGSCEVQQQPGHAIEKDHASACSGTHICCLRRLRIWG